MQARPGAGRRERNAVAAWKSNDEAWAGFEVRAGTDAGRGGGHRMRSRCTRLPLAGIVAFCAGMLLFPEPLAGGGPGTAICSGETAVAAGKPSAPEVHPFYISVCQVDHNPDTGALEMSFRIFTDDLELALETMGTDRLRLGSEREAEKADLYISRYLARHVEIEIDGRRVSAAFLGKEVDSDAIWCYVEAENVPALETMTITNTLLLETYEDQVNLVHVNANGQKKSLVFNGQQVRQTLDF